MLFFSIIVKIFSRRFLMAIIGNSPAMQRLRKQIEKIAKTNAAILLQGESGTGKELVAMAIHKLSERSSKEFVAINCGAIPESLMESLLFGYEEGAFSGAKKNGQQGLLETANGGTLFLDEAGEMPYLMQAKILRTLQNNKIRRLGASKSIQLDVRIISASNKNLRKQVELGNFRKDLFYRLDVIPIFIPPLRERMEDVPLLIEFFLKDFENQYHTKFSVTTGLLKKFMEYHWPGNIRELRNFIEYGVCFCEDGILSAELYEPRFALALNPTEQEIILKPKQKTKKEHIQKLLGIHGASTKGKIKTAQELGISLATLYRHLKN